MAERAGPPLVVLAAGLSTRYGRLKQVDPLGPAGEAIMDYNVWDAVQAGFGSIVCVVRPEIEETVAGHVRALVGEGVPVTFVAQTLDHLPEGFHAPPDRTRPWGTAQAVLCAADHVSGPFAVCNADDLYGPDAFRRLHAHLTSVPPATEAALVGYVLDETLSGAGGVARGICVMGREGLLQRVTEVREIRRVDGWISGRDTEGEPVELQGHEIASMNLWGFTDLVVEMLERQFRRFLGRWGANTDAEFFLSTAINGQVEAGAARVAVLDSSDPWFGVTHPSDHGAAQRTLAERVAGGVYPRSLPEAFAARG